MPRPIWKGQISFGLVTIPVVLYSAEAKATGVSFHLVDKKNHARIRNQRVNEETGKPVEWDDIVRGYELSDGSYLYFTDDELSEMEVEANQSVEIAEFVDASAIDPAFFEKPYYLVPEKRGRKGYVILREALKKSKKVGIAKVVIRTKEYLASVIPKDDALMLELMRYSHEIRLPKEEELPSGSLKENGVTPKELEIAQQLINALSGPWEPEQYKNEYRDALMKWIDEHAKNADKKRKKAETEETPGEKKGEVIDLMSLLKESMNKAKSSTAKAPAKRKKTS